MESKLRSHSPCDHKGPKQLYLGEEAVAETVVQAEVQAEFSLSEAELVEARGKKEKKKAIPVKTESPERSPEVIGIMES